MWATLTTNIAANVVAPANAFVNVAPNAVSFNTGALVTALLGIAIMPWKLVSMGSGSPHPCPHMFRIEIVGVATLQGVAALLGQGHHALELGEPGFLKCMSGPIILAETQHCLLASHASPWHNFLHYPPNADFFFIRLHQHMAGRLLSAAGPCHWSGDGRLLAGAALQAGRRLALHQGREEPVLVQGARGI